MARTELTRSGRQFAFEATDATQLLLDDVTRQKRGSTRVQNISDTDVWLGLDATMDETNGWLLPAYTEAAGNVPPEIWFEEHSGPIYIIANVVSPATAEVRVMEFFD